MEGIHYVNEIVPKHWDQFKDMLFKEGWLDPNISTDYDVHLSISNARSLFALDSSGNVASGLLYCFEKDDSIYFATFMTRQDLRGKGIGSALAQEFHRRMATAYPQLPLTVGSADDMTEKYRARDFPHALPWRHRRFYCRSSKLAAVTARRIAQLGTSVATAELPRSELARADVMGLDKKVSGRCRSEFYSCLGRIDSVRGRWATGGGGLLLSRQIKGAVKLGPIYADSLPVALQLLSDGLADWDHIGDSMVSLTIPTLGGINQDWLEMLEEAADRKLFFDLSSTRPINYEEHWKNVNVPMIFAETNHQNQPFV